MYFHNVPVEIFLKGKLYFDLLLKAVKFLYFLFFQYSKGACIEDFFRKLICRFFEFNVEGVSFNVNFMIF